MKRAAVLAAFALFGCDPGNPAPEPPATEPDAATEVVPASAPTGSGVLRGRVTFRGEALAEPVEMTETRCRAQHGEPPVSNAVLVGPDGGLANVLVYVKDVPGRFPPPSDPVEFDQRGCIYLPRIRAVMTGQPIVVRNSDDWLHNVRWTPKRSRGGDEGMPGKGRIRIDPFRVPELSIPFSCSVHPWMGAKLHVLSHPYFALTADDGSFEIRGAPAGQWTIAALHETLGERTVAVQVGDGPLAEPLEFVFE